MSLQNAGGRVFRNGAGGRRTQVSGLNVLGAVIGSMGIEHALHKSGHGDQTSIAYKGQVDDWVNSQQHSRAMEQLSANHSHALEVQSRQHSFGIGGREHESAMLDKKHGQNVEAMTLKHRQGMESGTQQHQHGLESGAQKHQQGLESASQKHQHGMDTFSHKANTELDVEGRRITMLKAAGLRPTNVVPFDDSPFQRTSKPAPAPQAPGGASGVWAHCAECGYSHEKGNFAPGSHPPDELGQHSGVQNIPAPKSPTIAPTVADSPKPARKSRAKKPPQNDTLL